MRLNEKRAADGVSPLVMRALGVLLITLMATTASPASSAASMDCDACPVMATSDCEDESCTGEHGSECTSGMIPGGCEGCYTWQCTETGCVPDGKEEETGKRVECVLGVQT